MANKHILFAFLGYLLRFKPIKENIGCLCNTDCSAWIYHEINSIVQEYAKKLNTESHQIMDDTYKEIDENVQTSIPKKMF